MTARNGDKMTIELKSMAVAMPEVRGHPNRRAFQGVLTMVDVPSEHAPSGAKGHLVVLTRRAAEAALPSLLGMGVDYSPALDGMHVRCKVGVITRAEIVGRNIELGGYLFARDFPEIVEEIAKSARENGRRSFESSRKASDHFCGVHAVAVDSAMKLLAEGRGLRSSLRAAAREILSLAEGLGGKNKRGRKVDPSYRAYVRKPGILSGAGGLGMSYEVTEVQLADPRARRWMLEKVTFTGAAILRRDKAAYRDTWIELG